MIESLCIKVETKYGELIRLFALENNLFNKNCKIKVEGNQIYIPIIRDLTSEEKSKLDKLDFSYKIIKDNFKSLKEYPKDYRDYLKDKIPDYVYNLLPKSYDIIGHIAIIEIPNEIKTYENMIGSALIKTFKNIKTVYAKSSSIGGEFRIRDLRLIGGTDNPITIHRENHCLFKLNIKKVYYSPRLSTERMRIVNLVSNGEKIIDMFAGVGPFSIQIAKFKNVKILAFDINPEAIKYLKENIILNKITTITPILGDVRNFSKKYANYANRVIMNLPGSAFSFLKTACEFISENGGIIHYYQFAFLDNNLNELAENIINEIEKYNRKVEKILYLKKVKQISPNKLQIVIDFKIN